MSPNDRNLYATGGCGQSEEFVDWALRKITVFSGGGELTRSSGPGVPGLIPTQDPREAGPEEFSPEALLSPD